MSSFVRFYKDLSKIIKLPKRVKISSYTKSLICVIENLTSQKWQDLLEQEDAQIELFEFFEKVKLQTSFEIESKNTLLTFRALFSQINYFEKSDASSSIQILSSIEARLINRNLVIISSFE